MTNLELLQKTVLFKGSSSEELEMALACRPDMIGINNRDLRSFDVTMETTRRLRPLVPDSIPVVSESGYKDGSNVLEARAIGVSAILVGESLVTAADLLHAIAELYGEESP